MSHKGLFIVLYGTNGVGKTTQALKLLERISKEKAPCAQYMKFPNYELLPTGPRINDYLRKKNPENLTTEEFQVLCAENRRDAGWRIKKILAEGGIIVAEDWTYGGIVWGIATGIPTERAYDINEGMLLEDIAILLDGEPFSAGKEKEHTHEKDDNLLLRVRKTYRLIAAEKKEWKIVSSNQSEDKAHTDIWDIVSQYLKK